MKYSEEFKAEIMAAYYDITTSVSVFLTNASIPRSTYYGWLQKYNAGQEKKREPKYTTAEYNELQIVPGQQINDRVHFDCKTAYRHK